MLPLNARIAAVLAAAMVVPSCSGRTPDHPAHSTPSDAPVVTGEPAGDNAADIAFTDTLVAQDQQWIDVGMLVPSRSTDSSVVTFAAASVSARRSEMTVLKVMQVQWTSDQDDPSGRQKQVTREGMIDPPTVAKLQSSRDGPFETLWRQAMLGLEKASIDAANTEVGDGKNIDAVGFAKQIVAGRQAEIDQLTKMGGA